MCGRPMATTRQAIASARSACPAYYDPAGAQVIGIRIGCAQQACPVVGDRGLEGLDVVVRLFDLDCNGIE